MKNNQETILGLLHALDDAIVSRNRRYNSLDNYFQNSEGKILQKEYNDYLRRRDSISQRFKKDAVDYQEKIDRLCQVIRSRQPVLMDLSERYINTRGMFPRNIALGKLHVSYKQLDFFVPNTFSFPFDKPMYICDKEKYNLLHKVLLRLLFALPIDKQEYYVFDPIGLGKTISKFNSLFHSEGLFPDKKILTSKEELKSVLKAMKEYILDLQTNVFNIETNCHDWESYNRRLYSQGELRRSLPYKVFIFTNIPEGMDQECFDMFRMLITHGKTCGILVLFSFNKEILAVEDSKIKKIELDLKECVEKSLPLHAVFEDDNITKQFQHLSVEHVGEIFPDDFGLLTCLNDLKAKLDNQNILGYSFNEMMERDEFFGHNSSEGLKIPIGCGASGGSIVNLDIGDSTPHYLIGGATGSGKSNLLHNIIVSACCRYSPHELNVYLLDFKEGVEFSQYANPILKHAKLIATEADTEYGITVLKHLVEEKVRRYDSFKKYGCKDIQGFRHKNPDILMPRIVVLIDEFQVLFGNEQKAQTITTLEMLAKQGRACGIHLILATQSLKGIDVSTLVSQFTGRIALKSSVDDSKYILGGITSNNEEAAELKVPFAILNVSQGLVSGNIKFMVPYAEEHTIKSWVNRIQQYCDINGIETENRVFEGQTLPHRPEITAYIENDGLQFILGECMDYNSEQFSIHLKPRVGENLLICGHNDKIKKSLMESIIQSGIVSQYIEEIVYIGDYDNMISDRLKNDVICLASMNDFYMSYAESPFDKKRIVIIDNCNLTKEIGYTNPSYGTPKDGAAFFKDYLESANENGSHMVAVYEGTNRIKISALPKDEFNYRVGYSVNIDEKNYLLGAGAMSNSSVKENRVFFIENQELKSWFKPYI